MPQSTLIRAPGIEVLGRLPHGAPLFGPGDAERLDRCAVLLRLAEDLERSRDQLVRSTSMALDNGSVRLQLNAEGESALQRWASARERQLFERAFHRELDVAA